MELLVINVKMKIENYPIAIVEKDIMIIMENVNLMFNVLKLNSMDLIKNVMNVT